MSKGLACTVAFIFGVAAGSFATWKMLKSKYEQIADEEIESVRSIYMENKKATEEDEPEVDKTATVKAYHEELKKHSYTNYSTPANHAVDEPVSEADGEEDPRVISPDEYGEIQEYDTINLTYYADGVLADDLDETIADVPATVGDALEHIGEYESDCVHVCNDARRCYFEILRDVRTYDEVTNGGINE